MALTRLGRRKKTEVRNDVISLTCNHTLSALSFGALECVQKVRKTADGDGTKAGVEVCLACEPNGSDGSRREDLLHPLLHFFDRLRRAWPSDWPKQTRGSFGPVLPPPSLRSQSPKLNVLFHSRECTRDYICIL